MRTPTSFCHLGIVAGAWLVLASAHAQLSIEWQASFGGTNDDILNHLQQTSDGGYLLIGGSNSGVSGNKTNASTGVWLVKVDGSGNKQWEQIVAGSVVSAQPTSDGGYLLAGSYYDAFGISDYWLMKVDHSWNKEWEKFFGGTNEERLASMQPTSDGGYILGGYSNSGISGNKTTASFGGWDYWLVKVDGGGNKQWEQAFGGSGDDEIASVKPTSDGGYFLGGTSGSGVSGNKTTASFGNDDYWLVKVDGSGNKQWEKVFGGSDYDAMLGMCSTSDGGVILGGSSFSGMSGNKTSQNFGGGDYWLVKVDSGGNKQWEQAFGGSSSEVLFSVEPTSDGGCILGGWSLSGVSGNKTTPNFGSYDYWLVKVDGSGNKQWDQDFGGTDLEVLGSVRQTSDGGYILGGQSSSGVSGNKTTPSFGGNDYWVVKLKSPPPFRLTAGSFTNGNFTLQLSGLSGHRDVVISASTNLVDWSPIFTNPPIIGSLEYVDSPPTNTRRRFYRAQE